MASNLVPQITNAPAGPETYVGRAVAKYFGTGTPTPGFFTGAVVSFALPDPDETADAGTSWKAHYDDGDKADHSAAELG